MARQKKTTAKRGRPAKNAAAPKRKYTRRKISAELQTPDGAEMFSLTQAQRNEGFRHQALYMALETRKLTQGIPVDVGALIEDADKIRAYLSDGLPKADPAAPIDLDGPMSSGGDDEFDPNAPNPGPAPDASVTSSLAST